MTYLFITEYIKSQGNNF